MQLRHRWIEEILMGRSHLQRYGPVVTLFCEVITDIVVNPFPLLLKFAQLYLSGVNPFEMHGQ